MSTPFLLILLPAFVYGIHVEIKAAINEKEASVDVLGADFDVITDKERESFQIQDEPLKDAVKMYSGERPDHVYVNKWKDLDDSNADSLYPLLDWTAVFRFIEPSIKILTVTSEPVTVSTNEYINNSTGKVNYTATFTQYLEDTVTHSWSNSEAFTVPEEIIYIIEFEATGFDGNKSLTYSAPWGEDISKSKITPIDKSSGIVVELEPEQRVVSTLNAIRTTMEVEVKYVGNLDGYVACNYKDLFKGEHYWKYDIKDVLKAAKLPANVVSKEIIKIDFYSNAEVKVEDVKTTQTLSMVPMFFHFMNGDLQ